MVIIIAIGATGTLGFFTFGKLLMSLREKEEAVGCWAGSIGSRGRKPCIVALGCSAIRVVRGTLLVVAAGRWDM